MKLTLNQKNMAILLAFACTTMLLGCGGTQRQSIEGTVTFNGQQIQEGSIKLIPIDGTKGPSGGALIKDGKFSIPKEKGVFSGTFRVEILATKETGRKQQDMMGEAISQRIQYIPPKYNRDSTLTKEITGDGENELTFDLTP